MRAAGGVPVPLADLLAPEFLQAPELMFSDDKYHPSAAGYALAAKQLLPALCNALGEWTGAHGARAAVGGARGRAGRSTARLTAVEPAVRRRTTGVPAPVVVPAG